MHRNAELELERSVQDMQMQVVQAGLFQDMNSLNPITITAVLCQAGMLSNAGASQVAFQKAEIAVLIQIAADIQGV